jgi:hypothetical protein
MAMPLGFNFAVRDGDTVGIAVETYTMRIQRADEGNGWV